MDDVSRQLELAGLLGFGEGGDPLPPIDPFNPDQQDGISSDLFFFDPTFGFGGAGGLGGDDPSTHTDAEFGETKTGAGTRRRRWTASEVGQALRLLRDAYPDDAFVRYAFDDCRWIPWRYALTHAVMLRERKRKDAREMLQTIRKLSELPPAKE